MANPEHIEWLLEGVDSWNQRRAKKDFEPDLSGANIYGLFDEADMLDEDDYIPLSNINFDIANLKNAQLLNARLNEATLQGALLDWANLFSANLSGAKMQRARLYRARLYDADLTDAKLNLASLQQAYLSRTTLRGTDLSSTELTGAEFRASRPWEAKLYRDSVPKSRSYQDVKWDKPINCVADVIKQCNKLDTNDSDGVIYYRGEATNKWELRPSVMRLQEPGKISLISKESNMLLDLMSRRPEDFTNVTSALDQWVLAQHYGLKTRLLDVTRNPLVALFSACESQDNTGRLHVFAVPKELIKPFNSDTISIVANFCKLSRAEQILLLGWSEEDIEKREPDQKYQGRYSTGRNRLYHLIRQEKPNFKKLIDPRDFFRVFVVEPQQSFERIRAQSGAFLISAFHERFEQNKVLEFNPGIPIYRHFMIEVPKESKQGIIDELRLLNVTRETLYPGLDESANAITNRYLKELGVVAPKREL